MNKTFLSSCPVFAGIGDFAFFTDCLHPRVKKCVAGEKLELSIGKKRFFGLVVLGNITSQFGSYTRGDSFGLAHAITGSDNEKYISRTKSTVYLIPADIFTSPCAAHCRQRDQVLHNCMALLVQEVQAERTRTELLCIHGIKSRLCAYLRMQYLASKGPYITLPFNRNQLADYLSLSRPSMSRELCALRDDGVLDFDGRTVKILNYEELCKL